MFTSRIGLERSALRRLGAARLSGSPRKRVASLLIPLAIGNRPKLAGDMVMVASGLL
mgnify:CR=1